MGEQDAHGDERNPTRRETADPPEVVLAESRRTPVRRGRPRVESTGQVISSRLSAEELRAFDALCDALGARSRSGGLRSVIRMASGFLEFSREDSVRLEEIRFELHKNGAEAKPFLRGLAGPLLETPGEFILHGFSYPDYLRDLGQDAQAEVYKRSSLDRALRSAFRITRKFLMDAWGLGEDEAIAVLSTAVDFGITQVADGNWGVHAIIPKAMFRPDRQG